MLDTKAPGGIRGNAASLNIGFKGLVRSVDVRTNKMLATHSAPYESLSGALATAGGLVFTAFTDGRIVALNDDTLEEMWHFNSNVTTKAPVFTFSVKGKQFVAIIAGGGRAGSDYTASWPEAKNWVNGPVMLMFSL
jgi:alcohol dehydrogenase (cytochrome c)